MSHCCIAFVTCVTASQIFLTAIAGAEPAVAAGGGATLVIVVSGTETIVLQARDGTISWSATVDSVTRPVQQGKCDGQPVGLLEKTFGQVEQARIAKAGGDGRPAIECTLLLIGNSGVRQCVALDEPQKAVLVAALRPVFNDVLKAGMFGKGNMMMSLLRNGPAELITPRN